jgi:photosystem II stability/assembly factor-like uncharacterized protein
MSLIWAACAPLPHSPMAKDGHPLACSHLSMPDGRIARPQGIITSHEQPELGLGPLRILDRNNLWVVPRYVIEPPPIGSIGSRILHSSDGGQSWQSQMWETERQLDDVAFINQQVGWVCGSGGLIRKTTDGGKNWSKQGTPTEDDLVEIQFINGDIGWAIGSEGEVLRTTDGGSHWVSHRIKAEHELYLLCFRDRLNGWMLGNHNQAYESTDGGVSWKSRATDLVGILDSSGKHEAIFLSAKFFGSKVGYIAAYISPRIEFQDDESTFAKNVIFKTDDGGRSWRILFEKAGFPMNGVEFISEDEMWMIHQDDDERVRHSVDGGRIWSKVSTFPSLSISSVYFADPSNGWAVEDGESNKFYRTTDGGKSWKQLKWPQATLSRK